MSWGVGHFWLIAIVLVIVLIIWGPGKLPDVGAGLGRAIREFRKASTDTRDEFHRATGWDDRSQTTPVSQPQPVAAADPLRPQDPTMPQVPTQAAPGAPAYPAAAGGGTVLGPAPENDRA